MKTLVERHADEPFAVLGVNTDKDPAAFRAKCAEFGVTWDNVFSGDTGTGIPLAWGVSAYPTIYVIGPDGTLLAEGLRGEALDRFVADQLDGSPRR